MADALPAPLTLRAPRWRWPMLAAVCLAVLIGAYVTARQVNLSEARAQAAAQAAFYKSTLDAAMERPAALPHILAHDTAVLAALASGDGAALNTRLEGFATAAEVDAIYLMDRSGLTIAASNHREEVTFLGQRYDFRPYFRAAMAGTPGAFFAIGATSGRAGYFVSEPVRDASGGIAGVIAIKIDLNPLMDVWRAAGEKVLVVNSDGVVVLASDPAWIYRTLALLSDDVRQRLRDARQFGAEPLAPLDWAASGDGFVALGGEGHILETVSVGTLGWQVNYLSDLGEVEARARTVVGLALVVLSLGLAAALFWRSRQIGLALEVSQEDQRTLRALNDKLEREIEVRRQAERRLEAAQSELAASSRLAALGQLAASVTHELGQPLSAMRNYIASLRLNGPAEDIERFTGRMEAVTERMDALTRQLRFFARPGEEAFARVDLAEVVRGAQEMMQADLAAAGVALKVEMPRRAVFVRGNRMRLEQVVVNLLQNARDAVAEVADKTVAVSGRSEGGTAVLSVRDNGSGIAAEVADQIFDPFTSTKPSGQGMGLGLSISRAIALDHGGSLEAAAAPGGGADFILRLPENPGAPGPA